MQTSYDADEFLKRGFFGSIIGFRKRSSSKTEQPPPKNQPRVCETVQQPVEPRQLPEVLISPQPCDITQQVVTSSIPPHLPSRTEYDIYREIVSEAELIERSTTTTPLSEFSSPTTPQPFYSPIQGPIDIPPHLHPSMMHHDPRKLYPPYHMVMTSSAPHPIPVDQNGVPLGGNQCPMAPPPYCNFAPPQSANDQMPPQSSENLVDLHKIPYEMKREIQEHLGANQNGQKVSIEEIVKMVVTALKDSQIDELKEESPEEILRRKRVQNNLAAARYRKRQRDAREDAELELGELNRRNDELRDTVAKMEEEIALLKQAVLNR